MKNTTYSNCDIKDLNEILVEGLLPISITNNNGWENDNRADNSCDKVYMFQPKTSLNSFIEYGMARLTIESTGKLEISELEEFDHHEDLYVEIVADKISAKDIVAVTLPKFLKNRIEAEYPELSNNSKITYKSCYAKVFYENGDVKIAGDKELSDLAGVKLNTCEYGYCRKFNEDRALVADIKELTYID